MSDAPGWAALRSRLVWEDAAALVLDKPAGLSVTGDTLLLVGTATLGSFTTFSTWMLETERLAEEGDGWIGLLNVGGSLAGGLIAAALGWLLGGAL